MSRTFPWHSAASATYHNNSDCRAGNDIERHARLDGTGGKRLCSTCAALNHAERIRDVPSDDDAPPQTCSRLVPCGLEPGLGGAQAMVFAAGVRSGR